MKENPNDQDEEESNIAHLRGDYASWRRQQKIDRVPYVPLYRGQADAILGDARFTASERLVLLYLLVHSSKNGEVAQISVAQIARAVCLKDRAVQRAIRHFEECNLVRRVQFHVNSTANYYLIPPSGLPADPDA